MGLGLGANAKEVTNLQGVGFSWQAKRLLASEGLLASVSSEYREFAERNRQPTDGGCFRQLFRGFVPSLIRDAWCHLLGVRTLYFLFDVLWSALIDAFVKCRSSLDLLSL